MKQVVSKDNLLANMSKAQRGFDITCVALTVVCCFAIMALIGIGIYGVFRVYPLY